MRPVRADRRLDPAQGHRRRQVQVPVRGRHVPRRARQRRGLQERAERARCRAERQPRGVPGLQDRAVLHEVAPGRERRQVQGRQLPDQGRRHRPGAEEQRQVPGRGQEGHLRRLGDGHVEDLRRQQGRGDRHSRLRHGRQAAQRRQHDLHRGRLQQGGGRGHEGLTAGPGPTAP
ncbi:hypothetical protein SGPA1_31269 [Streptomyces misionensis JCM 4497]